MTVAIVGAGIAGLAAARTLKNHGHESVLFEKQGAPGGRVDTRSLDGYTFDTGATSFAPRGRSIEPVILQELDKTNLVKVEKPIYTHNMLRVSRGDAGKNAIGRYTYSIGNAELPRLLAETLNVRLNTEVVSLETANGAFKVNGEDFEAVILTPPVPITADLLALTDLRFLARVTYRPCLSVSLGYTQELEEVPYHAIVDPEQRHPLTWLSLESVKSPGRAPGKGTAMVAQLSPQFSAMHVEAEDGAIVAATVDYIERLYGEEWNSPAVFDVKRWRYSQPESVAMFDSVNQPGSKLLIASDGLLGGRVEYAYEVGVKAANLLLQNP